MKYRIKEKNGQFIPQRRILFAWIGYSDTYCSYDILRSYEDITYARTFIADIIAGRRDKRGFPKQTEPDYFIHTYP